MARVICHWSAGRHEASSVDRQHYHLIIEDDGNLVRGDLSIKANEAPIRGNYAAHTLGTNTGSIGVALACMVGAIENPFRAGVAPMTATQWETLIEVVADLCRRYGIEPTPTTVLSHAEVQANLGNRQRGKWDFTRLAFDPDIVGACTIGDRLRMAVGIAMAGGAVRAIEEPAAAETGAPGDMELRGATTAGWLNFRRAPDGEIIGGLPRGTAIAIVDSDDGWYRARTPGGHLGWVSARYVSLT
ncbi:N-acetylmuramoyl-L-alanine amidase [Aureimonas sp. SA4125]|uniref:N-acetylmuramoyl-L-alanine amidase n=1 Tax=Aureimonas sp. SA4125 TaxID=2826993 RepID=UPI001CC4A7CB|nr:N-acetylmuramoyl-L-alanine amidase [Aureimonas sp. SA4125]